MIQRPVMINGKVYDRHEIATITLIPGTRAVLGIRSWCETDEDNVSEAVELGYEVAWEDGMTIAEWEEVAWDLPEFEEWTDTSAALDEVLDILTDEQAETIPQLYPEWKAGTEYAVGKRVRYADKLYRCVQAHTSQEGWEPPATPAMWVRTSSDGEIPEWVQPIGAHDAYNVGDKVRHNGKVWVSNMDANVYEPGVYGWTEVSN